MTLFAVTNNNPRFVLTGGEPMTRPDIVEIVDHSCGSVDETVLSTTGDMLLNGLRAEGVWQALGRRPHASTVAVPLHAASAAVNSIVMPTLSGKQVERADVVAEVFRKAQSLGILATLRTTITGLQTREDILQIPEILKKRSVDLSKIRWKLYQYDPYVGPRSNADIVGKYSLTDQEFNEISSNIADEFRDGFKDISYHPICNSADNYVIVSPNGEVRVVESTEGNLPTEQYLCTDDGARLNITEQPVKLMDEVTSMMPLQLWDPELVEDEDLAELPHYRR
ncbi:MAG: Radical protein, partial [Patescibacteria group bacterium]|nr:Radical protein [Patescibacteria group bacterium]